MDAFYIKLKKNRRNEFIVLEIRIVVTLGVWWVIPTNRKGAQGRFHHSGNVLFLDLSSGYLAGLFH